MQISTTVTVFFMFTSNKGPMMFFEISLVKDFIVSIYYLYANEDRKKGRKGKATERTMSMKRIRENCTKK